MTIEDEKTWSLHPNGHRLTSQVITSPWSGLPTVAVIDLDAGEVIAVGGATCTPFQIALPLGVLAKLAQDGEQ